LLLHNLLWMDAPVVRFVALCVVLVACAQGQTARTGDGGDVDSSPMPDSAPDAFVPHDAPPPDACVPLTEICDGMDNDCDGHVDEGFDVGMPCDGPDLDQCAEGHIVCATDGTATCNDTSGNNVELCNGLDDDCQNGIDDTFPVGQSCTVGLGMCARTGMQICNSSQTGTQCNAMPGAPSAETCGDGVDQDCNGTDAVCPTNDTAAGAIDISAGGTFTVDLSAAHDDNFAASTATLDCGDMGGRDVFYTFSLPAEEVVYFDSFGSNFDTVIRVFAGSCAAPGATLACSDDSCSSTTSQGAIDLGAGTYCVVLDQFDNTVTAGAATLTFRRGGRAGIGISGSGSFTGSTTGKTDLSVASCEANTHQPDVGHFFTTCPGTHQVSASTCTGTAFDTIIYMKTGPATSADVACSDDEPGCGSSGFQSKLTNVSLIGANLQWIIVDGFGMTGNGTYKLTYAIP